MDFISVILFIILALKGAKKSSNSKLSNNCTFAA